MTEPIIQETPAETQLRCDKAGAEWLGDRVTFAYAKGSVDLPRARVRALFERHGLEKHLTADPRPETLLKAAAKAGKRPKGYLSRAFVSPLPDTPLAIHVTRVTGKDESGDEYSCLARVRIGHRQDPTTGSTVAFATAKPPEGQSVFADDTARNRAVWIAGHVNHQLTHVLTAEVLRALRAALSELGCAKSLGGGNNFWVPQGLSKRVHDFLRDLQAETGIYFERSPQTTLGAPQERATMAAAATVSLTDDLAALEAKLATEIEAAQNPTLTAKGNPIKRDNYIEARIETLREVQGKLALYERVVESRVIKRLDTLRSTLDAHYRTLLGGGDVLGWEPELWSDDEGEDEGGEAASVAPPSSDEEPSPTTQRSVPAPGSEPLAAAAADDDEDPFAWC